MKYSSKEKWFVKGKIFRHLFAGENLVKYQDLDVSKGNFIVPRKKVG